MKRYEDFPSVDDEVKLGKEDVKGVVDVLVKDVENIDCVYIIVRHKDGGFIDLFSGDMNGLAMAICILQKMFMDMAKRQIG